MKPRFLSLFLAVAVLCGCMAVTVGATEIETAQQQLINLLEFSTPNDSGNLWVYKDKTGFASARFELPYSTLIRYVDMVVSVQGGLKSAYLIVGSTRTALTVDVVSGTTYYRLYGTFSGVWADSLTIEFQSTTAAAGYIQFYSCDLSPQPLQNFASASTFLLEDKSATQTNGNTLVTLSYSFSGMNGMNTNWTSSVRNSNWRKYDFMTFTLSYYSHSINNINVQIDGRPVPYTVNTIENPPDYNGYTDPDYGLGNAVNIYSISLTVDLTGFQRTNTGDLIVTVQGMGTFCDASLHKCTGYIPADFPEAEITWLQKIWKGLQDGFKSVVDAITGDTGAAEDFQDQVTDKTDELGSIGSAMDSVVTPDEYDANVSGMENVGQLMAGGGLAYVIGSPYILPLFTASMGLCFASYALFGKKG